MAIAGKENDNGVVEFQFYRPENRTKWESFQKAIYDKSSNQVLGRTPKNWGQLLLFYTIFYVVLAALFAICMQGLFATLDDREPRWKMDDSLIGVNPGLGFRPISSKTEEGSLIWYNLTNYTTIEKWVSLTDKFLEPYNRPQTGDGFANCAFGDTPPKDRVCITTMNDFKNCNHQEKYGYNSSSPCVFLKLNRIYGWEPKYYTEPHKDMPPDLQRYISDIKVYAEKKQVWVSCNGADDVDKENIKGFNYFPHGFAHYYYPYKNIKDYLSPIVAVQILGVEPKVMVTIECRAWAENIEYRNGTLNRAGSVTFEIKIDADLPPPPEPTLQTQPNPTVASTQRTLLVLKQNNTNAT